MDCVFMSVSLDGFHCCQDLINRRDGRERKGTKRQGMKRNKIEARGLIPGGSRGWAPPFPAFESHEVVYI